MPPELLFSIMESPKLRSQRSRLTPPLFAVLFVIAGGVVALTQDAVISIDSAPWITVRGAPGMAQQIEWCDPLQAVSIWRTLTNVTQGADPVVVLDLTVPRGGNRFYRALTTGARSHSESADRPDEVLGNQAGRLGSGSAVRPPSEEHPGDGGIGFGVVSAKAPVAVAMTGAPQTPGLAIALVPILTLSGVPGTRVRIDWADALGDANQWRTLTNVTVDALPRRIVVDQDVALGAKRLYRAVTVPMEPAGCPPGFVWIQAGTFIMGTPDSEVDRGWEGPQTEVTLSTGFWIGQYEVTQKEYGVVKGVHKSTWTGDNLPVELVTWHEALDYCSKLTEQEQKAERLPKGYVYRLPTEAEWEYACRAGTSTRFSYGDDLDYAQLENYAWFEGNAETQTHPVGTKSPNPWGLYDMHGNVWEWCQDWYGAFLGGKTIDPLNLQTSFVGFYRTVRGGCLANAGRGCRSANRNGFGPDLPYYGLGFRVVLGRAL